MVRRWRRDQVTILSGGLKMSAKRVTMGRFTLKYPELDQRVMEWFSQQREQGWYLRFLSEILRVLEEFSVHGKQRLRLVRNMLLSWQFHNMSRKECCSHESNIIILFFVGIAVSGLMLRLNAKELSDDPSFKASGRWYEKWKWRHSVSMWTKTTLAQPLPADLKENIAWFHGFVIAARRRADYPLSRIYNMDETPMRFELPSNRTLEFSGSRTVPVKSCGAEKRSFTVVLAVAADGAKVPPKVIFKGVRTPRDLVVPHPLRVSFHKKGWMEEQGIWEWIWQSLPRAERSLLVWDSFRTHLTDSMKDDLKQRNIDVAVIPGGLTPVVQPLDKCLNKPFKDNVRWKYLAWMTLRPFEFTPAGKKKAPSRNLVLRWIKEAWAEIPQEMVIKSFKTCGISNALDRTEDDVVYSEETPEVDDEDIEENEFKTDSENETDGE